MHRFTRLLLAMLCCGLPALPARAATLPEAIARWTGLTADVEGRGERVRIGLPSQSPVPVVTADAKAATEAGEAGWRLTDIAIPVPAGLRAGGRLTVRSQHADAWLGDRTAHGSGSFAGIAVDRRGTVTRLDHAQLALAAADGPVRLELDLAGMHVDGAAHDAAPLLPRHLALRGHSTQAAITALAAMFAGQSADRAPVTIDALSFDLGPANFSGTGNVTFVSANDRRGRVTLEATGFAELMQAVPLEGSLLRLYPVLLILRQMAHKQNGRLVWTADFDGARIMIDGLDIGPLLGG